MEKLKIKKRGLDYFPLQTDFIHDRLVRRIMKHEGDATLSVLLCTLTYIYSGEGYYVPAGKTFYEDLSDCLYEAKPADVSRIIALAVEYGIFDAGMYARYGILTSAAIQSQFLFCTRRRRKNGIDPRYNLLEEEDTAEETATKAAAGRAAEAAVETPEVPKVSGKAGAEERENPASCSGPAFKPSEAQEKHVAKTVENVTFAPGNVTTDPKNVTSGTQSIAKHSIAQQSKENPLLQCSPGGGTGEGAARRHAEEDSLPGRLVRKRADGGVRAPSGGSAPEDRAEEYRRKLAQLRPPADGLPRNLEGLLLNLSQLRIPPQEQYAIVLKSNFGVIGHPMWRGFGALRESHGKIRQPGKYLLSLCK